jgi:hypothetical protein
VARVLASLLVLLVAGCTGAPGATSEATPRASSPGVPPSEAVASEVASAEPSSAPPAPPSAATPVAWRALPGSGPAPREDHTWTLDPESGTAYLFGGRDGATAYADLWVYDLRADAWTRVDVPAGPAARFGHEAVWLDGIGLVVFAGQAGPTFFNDLWAFDPADGRWEELPSSGAVPTPRYGTCAGIGPDGRLWISHGFTSDGTRFADTRAWDSSTGAWTDETPPGGLPVNRCLHGCWWTGDGTLALYGGQTTGVTALDDRWVLAGGSWTRIEGAQPPARNLYARAHLDGATLVFGGQGLDGGYLADAWWLLDAGGAARPVEIEAGEAPPGRSGAEMVVDAARDRVLLFGGRDGDGALDDLWALDGIASAP